MENRKRNIQMKFYVTEEEKRLIDEKMKQLPIKQYGAYFRKMAIDGYILVVDRSDTKAYIRELQAVSRNINQIAKRANATGTVYRQDIEDIKKAVDEIWRLQRRTLLCIFSFQNGIGFYFCNAAKLFFCKVFKGYFPLPPLALSRRYWKAKSSGFFYSVLPKSIESRICHHLSFLLNVITAWHIKPNTREKQPPPNSDAPHPAPDIVIKPPTKKIPMPRNIPTP